MNEKLKMFAQNLIIGNISSQDIRQVLGNDNRIKDWQKAFPYYYSFALCKFLPIESFNLALKCEYIKGIKPSYELKPFTELTPMQKFMQAVVIGNESFCDVKERFSRSKVEVLDKHVKYFYAVSTNRLIRRNAAGSFGLKTSTFVYSEVGPLDHLLKVTSIDKFKSSTYEIF